METFSFPVSISLPFTLGVAVSALVFSEEGLFFADTLLGLSTIFLFAYSFAGGKHERFLAPLLFFILGLFVYSCRVSAMGETPHLEVLESLRHNAHNWLSNAIGSIPFSDPETASLLLALLCGDRSSMSPQMRSSFRKAGASHLLALSGLHLGVIASTLRSTLSLIGRSRPASIIRSIVLISFCAIYTFICGASASLVRAFLFISIREVSIHFPNRKCDSAQTFALAATIQLCFDPTLISSTAFQLSYLAMAGLLFLSPRLQSWYPGNARFDPIRKLWNAMAVAISCQIATAPIVLLRFGSLPQFFLLANLLAMPLCELLIPVALFCIMIHGLWSGSAIDLLLTEKTKDIAALLLDVLETIASI